MSVFDTVPSSPQYVCPILTGTTMPAVTLRTAGGESFDLNKSVSQHPSVLVFYRGGW
jgi:peroxiredoxin